MADLNGLRAFVTTAKSGSLTKAAEALCVTQPAVTAQLKKFQSHLGLTLLQRSSHGMDLTEQGRQLLPAAEAAIDSFRQFETAARGLKATVKGRLKIGTIIDPEFLRLGETLRSMTARYPGMAFDLQQGISGSVQQDVLSGHLDVGYTLGENEFSDINPQLSVMQLASLTYQVVAPAGWHNEVIDKDWSELAKLPWIATPETSIHFKLLSNAFASAGVQPNVAARVDVEPSMLDLVKSGVALSLVRDNLAIKAAHEHGLVIANKVSLSAYLGLIWRQDRSGDPVIAAATTIVQQVW